MENKQPRGVRVSHIIAPICFAMAMMAVYQVGLDVETEQDADRSNMQAMYDNYQKPLSVYVVHFSVGDRWNFWMSSHRGKQADDGTYTISTRSEENLQ